MPVNRRHPRIRWSNEPLDAERESGGSTVARRRIGVGVIGTGWIGEIRAGVCAEHPLVESLHLAEL